MLTAFPNYFTTTKFSKKITVKQLSGQNQPSDAESIEIIRVSLTTKYVCRVQLATHRSTAILLVCIANLIKKSGHKLLSTVATFGFCLLC